MVRRVDLQLVPHWTLGFSQLVFLERLDLGGLVGVEGTDGGLGVVGVQGTG